MRIDVHHHFFPASMNKGSANVALGWRSPEGHLPWSPEVSLKLMDESAIDVAVISLPAVSVGEISDANRSLARQRNDYLSDLRKDHPDRFGFFASLPFLDDIEGALAEIAYALDVLRADGIALTSSYGVGPDAKYIGHDTYDPIWAELDRRQAVVFLHGGMTASSTPHPHEWLGIPIAEVPNETYKAAAHLVVTGRKRKYPKVKVILAHLGGSTVTLAARVAVLSPHMGCPLTPDEILQDFKTFYLDTALGCCEQNLASCERFAGHDQILFGTDLPAVSKEMAGWYTSELEKYYADNGNVLSQIFSQNAAKLFPNLGQPQRRD